MLHSTSPIGTDIQDGGYGLPRIPLPRTPVNKALSDALGSLVWHPTLTACILRACIVTMQG
jgi:hypothetical protein